MNVTDPQSYQEHDTLPARIVGVVRAPRRVFRAVISRPSWAGVLMLTFVVSAASSAALLSTDVGQQALVDQWERTALAFGRDVDDAAYARLQELSERGAAYGVLMAFVNGPVAAFGLAAVLFGVFNGVLGGRATYRQVLAVVAHAGVILALRQVLAAPLGYARETIASPTTMVLFFTMLDEASPLARFFGLIDVFVLWWALLLALGVSLLYRRPARPTTFAFVGAYVAFAAILALAMALAGGTA